MFRSIARLLSYSLTYLSFVTRVNLRISIDQDGHQLLPTTISCTVQWCPPNCIPGGGGREGYTDSSAHLASTSALALMSTCATLRCPLVQAKWRGVFESSSPSKAVCSRYWISFRTILCVCVCDNCFYLSWKMSIYTPSLILTTSLPSPLLHSRDMAILSG